MNTPRIQSKTPFGTRKLPARHAALVLPLFLTILMTFVVSLVSTLRAVGVPPDFLAIWMSAWGLSWLVAFPTILVAMPLARRMTAALVEAA